VKLFGIPIKIEPSFFLIVAFLALGRAAQPALLVEWILVVIISVLLHEFGHALAARAFGLAPEIRLYQMGGQTSWQSETELSPLKHLVISLAGPFVGFLFGGSIFLLAPILFRGNTSELAAVIYFDLLWVNIGWGVFNLLPMLPLDGGQVLASLEAWILRRRDAIVSHAASLLVALAITWWAFSRRWVWIGFLGIWFAYINGSFLYQKFQAHRDRSVQKDFDEISDVLAKEEYDRALELIKAIQARAKSPEAKREAAYLLVVTYLKQENFERAEEELHRYNALFGESSYLQGILYFLKGDPGAALPHLQSLFEQAPDKQTGLMIYKCLVARQSFAGALDFIRHPVLADTKWELLVDLQTEAFNRGEFGISAEAGKLADAEKPEPKVAYNVACASAKKGDTTEALAWLLRALELGFNDREALLADPDIEVLRSLPEFEALVAQFGLRH